MIAKTDSATEPALLPSEAPIVAVTVHPDGATVTRRGRAVVKRGRVEVCGLPLLLDPDSVRAGVEGARVHRVELGMTPPPRDEAPAATLRAELEALLDALATCDATRDGHLRARELLLGLAPRFGATDSARPTPHPERFADWLQTDALLAARVEVLDERIGDANRRRESLAAQVEATHRALAHLSGAERWRTWIPSRRLWMAVDGAEDGAIVGVTVSYRVPGARWSPSYVLQADGAALAGRFVLRASVTQVTGEDWSNAELTLTSLPAERRCDPGEPPPFRLDTSPPAPPVGWRPLADDLDALFPDGVTPEPPVTFGLDARLGPQLLPRISPDEPVPRTLTPARALQRPPVPPAADFSDLAPRAVRTPTPVAPPPRTHAPPPARVTPEPARAAAPQTHQPHVVHDDWIDYARLRLADANTSRARRGRLERAPDEALLAEISEAPTLDLQDRLAEALRDRRGAAQAVAARELPPGHVLPAVEAAPPLRGAEVAISAVGRVEVPSDGRVHTVVVASWPIALEIAYRAVPRLDDRVYRQAYVLVDYDRPLLPGPVELRVDGAPEGTTSWCGSDGRSELTLAFGPEPRLSIERKARYREEVHSDEQQRDGQQRTYTTIEVEVRSRLPRPVAVELLERVPLAPPGSDVVVEVTEAHPAALPHAGDANGPVLKGGRVQQVAVGPEGSARAVFGYAVTGPLTHEIIGGGRRG